MYTSFYVITKCASKEKYQGISIYNLWLKEFYKMEGMSSMGLN